MVPQSGSNASVLDPTLRPLTAKSTPPPSTSLVAREALRLSALADAQASLEHIASKPRSPVSPGRQTFALPRTRPPHERDASQPRSESGRHGGQTAVDRMNAESGVPSAQAAGKGTSYAHVAAAAPAEGSSTAAGPPQPSDSSPQPGRGSQPGAGSDQAQGQPQNESGMSYGHLQCRIPDYCANTG